MYEIDIINLGNKIKEYSERRIELKEISDYYTIRAEKYRALGEILQTKHTFFVTGFIPKKEIESLRMNLDCLAFLFWINEDSSNINVKSFSFRRSFLRHASS